MSRIKSCSQQQNFRCEFKKLLSAKKKFGRFLLRLIFLLYFLILATKINSKIDQQLPVIKLTCVLLTTHETEDTS